MAAADTAPLPEQESSKVMGTGIKLWRQQQGDSKPRSRTPPAAAAAERSAYDSLPTTESSDPAAAPSSDNDDNGDGNRAPRDRAWNARKLLVRLASASSALLYLALCAAQYAPPTPRPPEAYSIPYFNSGEYDDYRFNEYFLRSVVIIAAVVLAWDAAIAAAARLRGRSNGFLHPGYHLGFEIIVFGLALFELVITVLLTTKGAVTRNAKLRAAALAFCVVLIILRVTLFVMTCVEVSRRRRDVTKLLKSLQKQGYDISPEDLRKKQGGGGGGNSPRETSTSDPTKSSSPYSKPGQQPQELPQDTMPMGELAAGDSRTGPALELSEDTAVKPELDAAAAAGAAAGEEEGGKGKGKPPDRSKSSRSILGRWRPQAEGEVAELG